MAIVNGYASLEEFKVWIASAGLSLRADVDDDLVIERLIEAASRFFDRETGRTFYTRSETRFYDAPSGRTLWIDDDDLLAITTLTNGDGAALPPEAYWLLPVNSLPKYGVRLKPSTAYTWQSDLSTGREAAIAIDGDWGFSASAPSDVKQAVLELAQSLYRRRYGENVQGVAQVTAAGVVITPRDLSQFVSGTLEHYRRLL